MKKIICIFMALTMLVLLCACGSNVTHKLGMGVVVNTSSSKDGSVEIEATVATVILDDAGKIVSCKVDVAQNKLDVTDGIIADDAASTEFKTKREQGDSYNMKGASGIGKEWYEQAEAFENYVVGKTASEVENMDTSDETLLAGCTIGTTDLIEAVVKACNDSLASEFTGDAAALSVAVISTLDSSSKSAMDGEDGSANIYSSFAAAALDDSGKVLAAAYDEADPEVTFNDLGEITVDADYTVSTKRELREGYNMKGASGIGKEWYEQIDAFEDYVVGKTASEISSIDTADADLLAGCTIGTSSLIACTAKAAQAAN